MWLAGAIDVSVCAYLNPFTPLSPLRYYMRSSSVVTRSSRPARLLVVGGWLGLAFLMPGLARAHFLWLTAEGDKPTVHAFLSETPTPEAPEFLKHIEHARITSGGKALSW